jgi:hypothetical protein
MTMYIPNGRANIDTVMTAMNRVVNAEGVFMRNEWWFLAWGIRRFVGGGQEASLES